LPKPPAPKREPARALTDVLPQSPKDHVKILSDEPLLGDAEFSENSELTFDDALTIRCAWPYGCKARRTATALIRSAARQASALMVSQGLMPAVANAGSFRARAAGTAPRAA